MRASWSFDHLDVVVVELIFSAGGRGFDPRLGHTKSLALRDSITTDCHSLGTTVMVLVCLPKDHE